MSNRRGNTAVIAILIVIILAAGAIAWYMATNQPETTNTAANVRTNTTVTNATESDAALGVPEVPAVDSEADLAAAEATLDQVDFANDGGDSALLDSYLSEF